jgi:hypothetical protein
MTTIPLLLLKERERKLTRIITLSPKEMQNAIKELAQDKFMRRYGYNCEDIRSIEEVKYP